MSMMEIRIDIPALDRLCAILEQVDRAQLIEEVQAEIVKQLKEAARKQPKAEASTEANPSAPSGHLPFQGRQGEPEAKPEVKGEANPSAPSGHLPFQGRQDEPEAVTLDAVQRACAGLRDAGKLPQVKALFPEFGIKKLSDLEDAQLPAFAERLREMGGTL